VEEKWEVIVTKGENEPWWFFDDWKQDIRQYSLYHAKKEAIHAYWNLYEQLTNKYEYVKVKKTSLAAFWNKGEIAYCTQCEDDLQLYCGLIIMRNGTPYEFSHEDMRKAKGSSGKEEI